MARAVLRPWMPVGRETSEIPLFRKSLLVEAGPSKLQVRVVCIAIQNIIIFFSSFIRNVDGIFIFSSSNREILVVTISSR